MTHPPATQRDPEPLLDGRPHRDKRLYCDPTYSCNALVNKKPSQVLVDAGVSELPGKDSNLDKENQNLLCYRYTTG